VLLLRLILIPHVLPWLLLSGPPLTPLVPINVLGPSGYPVRNDNTTSISYVGSGNGSSLPEQYVAYHPADPSSSSPIQPGNTTVLKNVATGKWCRLELLSPNTAPGTLQASSRSAASVVSGCNGAVGVVCDQATAAGGTVLTYTGSGLSYQGVALLVLPVSQQLVLPPSSNTSCGGGGNSTLSFPLAPPGQWATC
jgi:hypothetical protein